MEYNGVPWNNIMECHGIIERSTMLESTITANSGRRLGEGELDIRVRE